MTTVMIWNNNAVSPFFAKVSNDDARTHKVVGHASVSIDDRFGPIFDKSRADLDYFSLKQDRSYVSWSYAYEDTSGAELVGYCVESFMLTLMMEQYAPDHIVRIPTPPAPYVARMKSVRTQHVRVKEDGQVNHYRSVRKNCARVTSRVLREGWNLGRGNIRYGQAVSGLWTPLMVKRLALDLKGGGSLTEPAYPMSWEAFIKELVEGGGVGLKTAYLLSRFQRRASNRGTSEATPRLVFQEKALTEKREMTFIPQLFAYAELRDAGVTSDVALRTIRYYLDATPRFHTYRHMAREVFRVLCQNVPLYEAARIPATFMPEFRRKP